MSAQIEDIALTMVPGLGARGVVYLLDIFGSAAAVFAASSGELVERAQLNPDIARRILSRESFAAAERELGYCRKQGITPIASTDHRYPQLMRETNDYPHIIYVSGSVEALSKRMISFVGTRRMTPYGEQCCNSIIEGLASRVPDICIVSGLAFGVDAASHRAAIASGATTVAVVANALPSVTPASHTALARDIVAHNGAIVTELHSQTHQNGSFYISRNRIMAAMSCGTVVIESAASGGSLATAKFADGYNRQVMAVPGRITDRFSEGCNILIRNRKAQPVLSADDILSELMWDFGLPSPESVVRDETVAESLLPVERGILEHFGNADTLSVAELMERSGMSFGELSAHMMSLELAGAVRQLPGNIFEKLVYLR